MPTSPGHAVIDYTNHRGERRERLILPLRVFWCDGNEFHPEPQYLLHAIDVERRVIRDFAMSGIHSWRPAT